MELSNSVKRRTEVLIYEKNHKLVPILHINAFITQTASQNIL